MWQVSRSGPPCWGWVVQDGKIKSNEEKEDGQSPEEQCDAYLSSVMPAEMMAAGAATAGLVHMVVATGFSTGARGQSPDAQLFFKPLLPLHVLISH